MGIPNIFNTGRSGMVAAKAAIATTGHNIANANTEGYSRQRVHTETERPQPAVGSKAFIGTGTHVDRVERVNDSYLEKQIRTVGRDLAGMEEKDVALKQLEDIFNELNGNGLNRLVSRFFNEFRRLSNEPENEAVRQSVREATQAMVNDFRRLRKEVDDVVKHIDSRLEGYAREATTLAKEVNELNMRVRAAELSGGEPNDLLDKRDTTMKKLATFLDVTQHLDEKGNYAVDLRGVGPMVVTPEHAEFSVARTPADDQGKPEGAYDLMSTAAASGVITHSAKGGKMGALLEVRDRAISTIMGRLDELAYGIAESVNSVHEQGFTATGRTGLKFFNPPVQRERAAEFLSLSQDVLDNVSNIATAQAPNAPGDNRIALAIASLQGERLLNNGQATFDEAYNSIVSDIGVAMAHNRFNLSQQRDVATQLGKIRDQISGVSIDEETANLMQYQQLFGASAKVIQIADEMLDTVLSLKR